jgi:hypothetical protein
MRLTRRQLRKMIIEGARDWKDMTRDAHAVQGSKDEEEFKTMVNVLLGRRGMNADQLKRLIDVVAGNYTAESDSDAYWEKRNSMSDPEDEEQEVMPAWEGSAGWE